LNKKALCNPNELLIINQKKLILGIAKLTKKVYSIITSRKFDFKVKTMKELPLLSQVQEQTFEQYEAKFKALADKQRLRIMYELTQRGKVCVCDLSEIVEMAQSKLSYHLKILLEANLINKETSGTWSYYEINQQEVEHLLSEELCCIFRPKNCC
jgi:ArsR family transcriptional regulator